MILKPLFLTVQWAEDYSKSVTRGFVAKTNAELNFMNIYPELVRGTVWPCSCGDAN